MTTKQELTSDDIIVKLQSQIAELTKRLEACEKYIMDKEQKVAQPPQYNFFGMTHSMR